MIPPTPIHDRLELRSMIENLLRTTGREAMADAFAALPEADACAPHDLPTFLRGHAATLRCYEFPGTAKSIEAMADRVEMAQKARRAERVVEFLRAFAFGLAFGLLLLVIARVVL